MARPTNVPGFTISRDDPLVEEHAAVAAWVEEAMKSKSLREESGRVDLKIRPTGKKLLEGNLEQSRRYVLAAVAQVRHWDQQTEQFCAQGANDVERTNPHLRPGYGPFGEGG